MSLLGLEGKVVLVTGAAAGIGAATAELFAEQGAVLALCDRAEGFGHGDDPFHRSFDVRDAVALSAFVEEVAARFGRIDAVVNNAGGTFGAPLLDVSAKGEAALIAENFTQVTQLVRAAVPHIPEGGCIVNVTSIEAHRAAPLFAVYSAMKAAQANLTQTLALELAPRGIRVNAMAPDVLVTEGTASAGGLAGAPEGSARPYRTPPNPPLGHWGTARTAPAPSCSWPVTWPASSPAPPCTWTAATWRLAAGTGSRSRRDRRAYELQMIACGSV